MSRDPVERPHAWPSLDAAPVASQPVRVQPVEPRVVFAAAPGWRRTLATLLDLFVPLTVWALGTWALVATDAEPLNMPRWNLFDQIIMTPAVCTGAGGRYSYHGVHIHNKPYMRQQDGNFAGYPFRTFVGNQFMNGYSDHFPVYIVLTRPE